MNNRLILEMTRLDYNKPWQLLVLIFIIILSFFQISNRIGEEQIKVWDESSSARNAVEMMISGEYLYATINGKSDYYDVKPPLQLWLKVISYKIFGINEFAVRFPTLVSYFILILLLFFFSRIYLKNDIIGLMLVLFPALSSGFVFQHMAWHGDTEMLLTLCTTIYILYAYRFLDKYPNHKRKYLIIFSFNNSIFY